MDELNGNILETKIKDILFTLMTTDNQKNNLYNNKSSINLGKCENIIKFVYNISYNDSLYIFKIEKKEELMKIPKIEYELYYPLYNDELIKLNLFERKGMKIDILIPVSIDEDIEKYNSSSDYYNNICSKTGSDGGVDMTLSDRRKEFINNNKTLCEEDCNLIEYNHKTGKAKCSCLIKVSIPLIDDIKFDKNKLYKNFIDYKNILNIKLMKCYNIILNGRNLLKNYGFFIYIYLLILFFIILFLFYCKYYLILQNIIKNISDAKIKIFQLEKKRINNKQTTFINRNGSNLRKILKNNTINSNKVNKKSKIIKHKNKRKIVPIFRPIKNIKRSKNIKINTSSSGTFKKINKINKKNENLTTFTDKKDYIKYKEILKNNDNEMNSLKYEKALLIDKRTFIQYYLSLLRSGQLFIFSFYSNTNDYNVQVIKIFLFFFFFAIQFLVNALFFDENTIHKIYEDKGEFNFIYQIPKIIYSSLISLIINGTLKFLSLSEKNIIQIKRQNSILNVNKKKKEILKKLKVTFVIFFLISFLLLLIFMYYIICFCSVYVNTQIHLIKDSFISFGLSMIYPFFIYLIPSIFRIIALNAPKKDKKYMYKFSKVFQLL